MNVISFVNMKGGVAKTTLAVNVADTLARRFESNILLIDIDPQFNATQCLIDGETYVQKLSEGGHTIVDVFEDQPRIFVNPVDGPQTRNPIAIDKIEPWEVKTRYNLIPGDLELYRLEFGGGQGREQRLLRLIEVLREQNKLDFIILDTPPTPSPWLFSALLASDHYVIPVKPEPTSRVGISLLKSVVDKVTERFGHDLSCLGVALTMANIHHIVYKDTVAYFSSEPYWKDKIFEKPLPIRTEIAREQGNQRLILDLNDSVAKAAISSITNEIIERLNNGQ